MNEDTQKLNQLRHSLTSVANEIGNLLDSRTLSNEIRTEFESLSTAIKTSLARLDEIEQD